MMSSLIPEQLQFSAIRHVINTRPRHPFHSSTATHRFNHDRHRRAQNKLNINYTIIKKSLKWCCLFLLIFSALTWLHFYKTKKQPPFSTTTAPTNVWSAASNESRHNCDCFSSTSKKCCDRVLLRAHKMGVVLLRDLFIQSFPDLLQTEIIDPTVLQIVTKIDYRHVVVTRPWQESIVSGYLYHKSGRECWLDQEGRPRRQNKTFEWESSLTLKTMIPPSHNRTLCQYLADVSEADGMRAFVDLSLHQFYAGILPHYHLVKQQTPQLRNKTLFVCFHELSNHYTQQATFEKIMKHLFPSNNDNHKLQGRYTFPPKQKRILSQQANVVATKEHDAAAAPAAADKVTSYGGGHATSKDPKLRERLMQLVEHYDKTLFDSVAAKATLLFGCYKKVKDENVIQ